MKKYDFDNLDKLDELDKEAMRVIISNAYAVELDENRVMDIHSDDVFALKMLCFNILLQLDERSIVSKKAVENMILFLLQLEKRTELLGGASPLAFADL